TDGPGNTDGRGGELSTTGGDASARRSEPSRYTCVSPVAQYTVWVWFACVCSRGECTGSPPSIGTNSIHPCHVPLSVGPPHARASCSLPSGPAIRCLYCSRVSAIRSLHLAGLGVQENDHSESAALSSALSG